MADAPYTSRLQTYVPTAILTPRLVLCTQGPEGTGKSDFALSAPKPLAYFVLDRGFENAKDEAYTRLRLDQVDTAAYSFDKAEAGAGTDSTALAKLAADGAWMPFRRDFTQALIKGRPVLRGGIPTGAWERYRTLVVDSSTEAWELLRLARFGKTEQVPPNLYTAVNTEFRGHLLKAAMKADCNVIFVHKMKAEYINKVNAKGQEVGVATGRTIRSGFKDFDYAVPTILQHTRDLTEPIPARYGLDVLKCALNPELEGLHFDGVDFPTFASLVYPDVDPGYWVTEG